VLRMMSESLLLPFGDGQETVLMAMALSFFFLPMQVRPRLEEDRGACPHQDHHTGNNRQILIPGNPDRMGVYVSACVATSIWGVQRVLLPRGG